MLPRSNVLCTMFINMRAIDEFSTDNMFTFFGIHLQYEYIKQKFSKQVTKISLTDLIIMRQIISGKVAVKTCS